MGIMGWSLAVCLSDLLPAPGWSTLWACNDNALLSIFRHFDSASVTKGLIGEVPQTMWLFDFPLLERTYYQLAVNFDVFGNVSHQAQTRLYFDLIRNGADPNFLLLMPADRSAVVQLGKECVRTCKSGGYP